MGASNAGGVGNICYRIDAVRTIVTTDSAVNRTDRHASVTLVYHNQHGQPRRREDNITEFSCMQRQIKAEVTNN